MEQAKIKLMNRIQSNGMELYANQKTKMRRKTSRTSSMTTWGTGNNFLSWQICGTSDEPHKCYARNGSKSIILNKFSCANAIEWESAGESGVCVCVLFSTRHTFSVSLVHRLVASKSTRRQICESNPNDAKIKIKWKTIMICLLQRQRTVRCSTLDLDCTEINKYFWSMFDMKWIDILRTIQSSMGLFIWSQYIFFSALLRSITSIHPSSGIQLIFMRNRPINLCYKLGFWFIKFNELNFVRT